MARILIIDDEPEVRTATRRILVRAGHDVLEASTGEEGVKVFAEAPADLVITDIIMPGQGGVETVAQLRELDGGVRIIAMSAHGLDELPEAAQLGAARTIVKPFSVSTLLELVDQVLRGDHPEEEDPLIDDGDLLLDDNMKWPPEDEEE